MHIIFGMTGPAGPYSQDILIFEVPRVLVGSTSAATVAEMVFIATNAPEEVIAGSDPLVQEIARQYEEGARFMGNEDGTEAYRRALSIGDTVTLEGFASQICKPRGFAEIV